MSRNPSDGDVTATSPHYRVVLLRGGKPKTQWYHKDLRGARRRAFALAELHSVPMSQVRDVPSPATLVPGQRPIFTIEVDASAYYGRSR